MNIDRTRLFDQRVVQRNIRAGRVTKDEYRAWLGELSDASENIKARDEGGDDDGYEAMPPKPEAEADPAAADVPPMGEAPAPGHVEAAPAAAPSVQAPAVAPGVPAPAPTAPDAGASQAPAPAAPVVDIPSSGDAS